MLILTISLLCLGLNEAHEAYEDMENGVLTAHMVDMHGVYVVATILATKRRLAHVRCSSMARRSLSPTSVFTTCWKGAWPAADSRRHVRIYSYC